MGGYKPHAPPRTPPTSHHTLWMAAALETPPQMSTACASGGSVGRRGQPCRRAVPRHQSNKRAPQPLESHFMCVYDVLERGGRQQACTGAMDGASGRRGRRRRQAAAAAPGCHLAAMLCGRSRWAAPLSPSLSLSLRNSAFPRLLHGIAQKTSRRPVPCAPV